MAQRGRPPQQGRRQGPAELVLAGAVARRHFVDGCSKVQIADEFGLSRFQVARMLTEARNQGWVRVQIVLPGHIDDAMSMEVARAVGIERAIVVEVPGKSDAGAREELGAVVAGLLGEHVTTGQVLGLTWSRTIASTVAQLDRLEKCTVVQLAGSLAAPDASSGTVELVRRVAALSGGDALPIYAPLVVEDAATAAALRRQPEIDRALRRADHLDVAVVSVGGWREGLSTVWDAVTPRERAEAGADGAVGEASGRLFDTDGRAITRVLDDRIVGITVEQLRQTPEVIVTAYGASRADAVAAAVRAGFVTTLVIDRSLAAELLVSR